MPDPCARFHSFGEPFCTTCGRHRADHSPEAVAAHEATSNGKPLPCQPGCPECQGMGEVYDKHGTGVAPRPCSRLKANRERAARARAICPRCFADHGLLDRDPITCCGTTFVRCARRHDGEGPAAMWHPKGEPCPHDTCRACEHLKGPGGMPKVDDRLGMCDPDWCPCRCHKAEPVEPGHGQVMECMPAGLLAGGNPGRVAFTTTIDLGQRGGKPLAFDVDVSVMVEAVPEYEEGYRSGCSLEPDDDTWELRWPGGQPVDSDTARDIVEANDLRCAAVEHVMQVAPCQDDIAPGVYRDQEGRRWRVRGDVKVPDRAEWWLVVESWGPSEPRIRLVSPDVVYDGWWVQVASEPTKVSDGFAKAFAQDWPERIAATLATACTECGKPVEEARRSYARPVCFACLPPPEPLPVVPLPSGPAV